MAHHLNMHLIRLLIGNRHELGDVSADEFTRLIAMIDDDVGLCIHALGDEAQIRTGANRVNNAAYQSCQNVYKDD